MALNIIFAGTPEFSVPSLQALLDSEHRVIAIYTQPDRPKGRGRKLQASPVKQLAEQHQIPVYQPQSWRDEDAQAELAALNPDLMIVIAYGLILPVAVLTTPNFGCINIHASLLPRWRGAAPIHRAILAGDKETGITTMQMDKGLDTGDMLLTATTTITADETAVSLHDKLADQGAKLIIETLDLLEQNQLNPIKQNNDDATYAEKIEKREGEIDWQESAETIERKVRAFTPWPGTFFHYNSETIKIQRARVVDSDSQNTPGTIINYTKDGLDVMTGNAILRITKLQLPGHKPTKIQDFINAHAGFFQPGDVCR